MELKRILKKRAYRYLDTVDIFIPSSLIIILLHFFYRIDLSTSFRNAHRELSFLTAGNFLILSFSADMKAVLLCLIFFILFLNLFAGRRWLKNTSASLFLITLSLFYFLSLEFFKVYEISFSLDLLDNEILSGWKDLLNSVLYELTALFYVKALSAVILFSPPLLDLMYRRYRFIDIAKTKRGSPAEKTLLFFPPVIILIIFIFLLLPGPERSAELIIDEIRIKKGDKPVLSVRDISKNPLGTFFREKKGESPGRLDLDAAEKSKFSFGLDTTSLSSNKVYPRNNIIGRGKKLNIIIYFFESTSLPYLDEKINNSYVTPNWRNLMKNAFVAQNHYANFPLSANSLYNVITSSYEEYSRDLVIQKYPRIKTPTIYEILKDNGYRTCLIHTGSLLYAGQRKFLENRKIDRIIEYRDLIKNTEHRRIVGYGIDERAMTKPAIDFMNRDRTRPFCVTLFPLNPHHPYAIPESRFMITGKIPQNTPRNRKRWMNYLNSLHFADFALGELVRELEKNGLMKNTLFVLFADHGQAFYQHRENLNHRRFLYEENVHVPFLIYNRDFFRKPVYYGGVSRHLDILPTLLDIVGIKLDTELEGISLFSSHREQSAMLHTSWNHEFFGIRDGRWKYIYRVEDGYEELYNLRRDPRETKNLAPGMGNRVMLFRHLVSRARLYNFKYYKKILRKDQQELPVSITNPEPNSESL